MLLVCLLLGNIEATADIRESGDYTSSQHTHALASETADTPKVASEEEEAPCFHCCHIHLSAVGELGFDVERSHSNNYGCKYKYQLLVHFSTPPTPPPTL